MIAVIASNVGNNILVIIIVIKISFIVFIFSLYSVDIWTQCILKYYDHPTDDLMMYDLYQHYNQSVNNYNDGN